LDEAQIAHKLTYESKANQLKLREFKFELLVKSGISFVTAYKRGFAIKEVAAQPALTDRTPAAQRFHVTNMTRRSSGWREKNIAG
jgi:hypothetical protein